VSQAEQAAPQPAAGEDAGDRSSALARQAPPTAVASLETTTDWLRRNAVMVTGVLLIAAQVWWKAGLLAHSFFRLDDYFFLERAATNGLTWKYLMWVNAGKLTPVGFAIAWLLVRISPYDWALTMAATLVLLACACLALLRMLRTLFGDHPGILILLLVYLVCPLSFPGLSWWSVTLELLPLQLAMFCAVTAHLHYLRTGRFRHAVASAGWLLAGMLSTFRGAGVPLLLFALTSAFFVDGRWSRAAWATLRDHWRVWSLYAVLTVGYIVVYVVQLGTSSDKPGRPGAFTGVFAFASTLLRNTFVPGIFGGPWRWFAAGGYAIASPPTALADMTWLLAAAVVIASLWNRPVAWRAWAILVGWLVFVDMVPVLLGRAFILPGALLGAETRYVWDAVGVLALCLGMAFLPVNAEQPVQPTGERPVQHGRLRVGWPVLAVTASVLTATVIGSIWSLHSYEADTTSAPGKSFIATARIALAEAPTGTVIVDDSVPQEVMGGLFVGPVAAASNLLAPLVTGRARGTPQFVAQPDGTFDHLMEFDGWGRLVPSVVAGAASRPLAAPRSCWPERNGTVVIQLRSQATNPSTVRLGYLAGSAGQVLVEFGGSADPYTVQQGLNSAFLPVTGSGRTILVVPISGNLPCIGDAEAGVLLPSGAGPAIPPLAVTG
jgi:hypothetical protein